MVLRLLEQVTSLTCRDEMDKMLEGKKQKLHPAVMESTRDAIETCLIKSHVGMKEKCLAEYDALSQCIKKNERSFAAKCDKLVRALQKCALKENVGK